MRSQLITVIAISFFCAVNGSAETIPAIDLETALSAALSTHPAMSGKRAEVNASEYGADAARAGRYPSLSAQVGQMKQQGGLARNSNQNVLAIQVRQPLWAFGRIDSVIEAADANTGVEKSDLLRVKRELLNQTVSAYMDVYGVMLRLQVLDESIVALEDMHRQIGRREVGQLASKVDVRLAALRLNQAKAQKQAATGEYQVALHKLQMLIQMRILSVKAIDERFGHFFEDSRDIERLAIENGAEISYKQALVKQAAASADGELYASMPTVYFQAERNFNQLGYQNTTRYGIMIDSSLDGMGLSLFGRSKAASARKKAADESLKVARNELISMVRSLMANRKAQQGIVDALQQANADLAAVRDSYLRQYKSGGKSWLDVLNIQREMTEQRMQLVQSRRNWLLYSLQLRVLIGAFDAI